MKGFRVAPRGLRACSGERRQDFELVATGDPPGRVDDFTRFVGWAVAGGAARATTGRPTSWWCRRSPRRGWAGRRWRRWPAGRPVVASRIGGLPFTVADGATGLLCEPGDPADLARKIETLLDDPGLRRRMGLAGRRRFEEQFAWEVVIERHYRPLLARVAAKPDRRARPAAACRRPSRGPEPARVDPPRRHHLRRPARPETTGAYCLRALAGWSRSSTSCPPISAGSPGRASTSTSASTTASTTACRRTSGPPPGGRSTPT